MVPVVVVVVEPKIDSKLSPNATSGLTTTTTTYHHSEPRGAPTEKGGRGTGLDTHLQRARTRATFIVSSRERATHSERADYDAM